MEEGDQSDMAVEVDDDEKDPDFEPEEDQEAEEAEDRNTKDKVDDVGQEVVARKGRAMERGGAKERARKRRPASRTCKKETVSFFYHPHFTYG